MQGIDHAIEEEQAQQQDARARARVLRHQERRARTVDEHKLVMAHVAELYNKARADELEREREDYRPIAGYEHYLKAAIMAKVVPTLNSSKRMDMEVELKMIHDGSIKVRGYNPGEWEWTWAQLVHAPDCVVDALYSVFLSVAGPSTDDSEPDDSEEEEGEDNGEPQPPVVEPEAPAAEPAADEAADEPADAIEAEFRQGLAQEMQAIAAESAVELQGAFERNRAAVEEINAHYNAQIAEANARLQEERERVANARAVAQHAVRDAAAHPVALPAAQVQPEPALAPGVEAALAEVPERQKRRKQAEDSRVLAEKLLQDGHIDEWQYTFLSNTAMEAFNDRAVHVHDEPESQFEPPDESDEDARPDLIRSSVMHTHYTTYVERNREIGKSLKDMAEWGQWVAACAHQETQEQSANLMTCIDKMEKWTARMMLPDDKDLARWKSKLESKKRKAEEHLDQYRRRCHCGPTDMPKSRAMPGSNVILSRHRDYVREWAEEDRRNNIGTSLEP
jgi:hypothetical protein